MIINQVEIQIKATEVHICLRNIIQLSTPTTPNPRLCILILAQNFCRFVKQLSGGKHLIFRGFRGLIDYLDVSQIRYYYS